MHTIDAVKKKRLWRNLSCHEIRKKKRIWDLVVKKTKTNKNAPPKPNQQQKESKG